jgi:hypothetical protein
MEGRDELKEFSMDELLSGMFGATLARHSALAKADFPNHCAIQDHSPLPQQLKALCLHKWAESPARQPLVKKDIHQLRSFRAHLTSLCHPKRHETFLLLDAHLGRLPRAGR